MASYFSYIPKTLYDLTGDPNQVTAQTVTNITKRVAFIKDLQSQASLYYDYVIKQHDTPENIADRYYGSPEYFWIVLLFNTIMDPELDWPKTDKILSQFIIDKYGLSHINDAHHYELVVEIFDVNSQTTTEFVYPIDLTTYQSTPATFQQSITNIDGSAATIITKTRVITNYDYETSINEAKRHIKILKKDYVGQIVDNLQQVFKN